MLVLGTILASQTSNKGIGMGFFLNLHLASMKSLLLLHKRLKHLKHRGLMGLFAQSHTWRDHFEHLRLTKKVIQWTNQVRFLDKPTVD